ncbi:hypothetical protein BBK82_45300 [Lentzea guizhouensis]|uniref:Uncharacterized protein n=1 Tax=Lentzea guizhouensis TaxID=1586287 RepID=A0A1B2HWM4_9PSEU|nr:hypothetical protein [Lentzea guizhouensis]ANZ42085.1 hypothetical protein BBK82_45300 [Lentzea guizhouensis]
MRRIWYVVGALGIVTALAYARDVADPVVIAGTPAPLSAESMRVLVDEACERPPGYRFGTLQRVRDSVLEVGVITTGTAGEFVVCTVSGTGKSTSKVSTPGAEHVLGRMGLIWDDDERLEVGRIAPGIAALEFVLPSGKVVKAELYGEVFLCRVDEKFTVVRIRAYDAAGGLLHDGLI